MRRAMGSVEEMSGAEGANPIFEIGRSGALVLDAIRRGGSVARSDLTERTPLSQQSVHRLAEDLLEKGFLRLEAPKIAGRGKPSPRLALSPDGAYGIGIAVDTEEVRVAVTNIVGDILHLVILDVEPNDPERVRDEAAERVPEIVAGLKLDRRRIAGVGISMQGYRRTRSLAFVPPPKIAAWRDRDVGEIFSGAFGLPLMAENNATLGAEAENWVGAGLRFDNFAYLSINLGFGGGVVINGAPYLGYHMNAAEISSIYTPEEQERRPALRTLIAMLREAGRDIGSVNALKRHYDPSWPEIDRWIERVTPALDQMLRAMTGILDPAAIVFGGEAPRDLRVRLAQASSPRTVDEINLPFPGPELLISEIETDPNVLGAALLPIRKRLFSATPGIHT
ncbi:ROK family transcriptional regulator [Martelella sp. AD-3]|uniref:ROK family transcriptional regulator n=1 Tax=Martelella sp. AD-3 TaxID=686597 RepID=UPI001378D499|nr:ROK family transcriptional regulator [Martelella sp. AD-3]